MHYRILNRWLSLALIIGITLTSTIAISEAIPVIISQSTGIASLKKSPPRKVVVDTAVAKATLAQLLAKVGKTAQQPMVKRTTVAGNYAIATWTWGEAGGQSILTKKQSRWQVLSSGGGAVDVATLKGAGVPESIARTLMQKETAAQQK
jgi:hypothetical protein